MKNILVLALSVLLTVCAGFGTAAKSRGVLLLTFDDRNFDDWTRAIPIFEKYGAHATFFVSGEFSPDAVRAVKELLSAGHSIG